MIDVDYDLTYDASHEEHGGPGKQVNRKITLLSGVSKEGAKAACNSSEDFRGLNSLRNTCNFKTLR